ncbi:hypothetical protein [Pedobacter nototheniae]|uniref:hypothetical protein n=1 Tax=Pedobacter nototheniae TaxID=2488994 RepID=UPI0029315B04|nr:hypothetical protein [Pedobacter nototheniae]
MFYQNKYLLKICKPRYKITWLFFCGPVSFDLISGGGGGYTGPPIVIGGGGSGNGTVEGGVSEGSKTTSSVTFEETETTGIPNSNPEKITYSAQLHCSAGSGTPVAIVESVSNMFMKVVNDSSTTYLPDGTEDRYTTLMNKSHNHSPFGL